MRRLVFVVLALAFFLPLTAQAQQWTEAQQGVWQVIEESWVADQADDPSWFDRFVHPNFKGWSATLPVPRDFETSKRWNQYERGNSESLIYSLHPVAIVVQGNTAVAYYFISGASENLKGERKTSHSRTIDTLIRENGEWKYLAWFGSDEASAGN